jgi:serine/threonine-protein kinase
MDKTDVAPGPARARHGLEHFTILRPLGQGGYGEVVEAWDERLQRKVAIKCLKGSAGVQHAGLLLKEARLAASLPHPAFVKIYAIEDTDNGQAIVMELIPGVTWRELIRSTPARPEAIGDMFAQLFDAMQDAHDAGLVHGDLKPSNLMLEPSGKVRILDLGLAFYDDAQATASVEELAHRGTIAYMAPECLLGRPPSRQSDIHALGVILYEMVAGVRPFGTLDGLALATAIIQSSSATWTFPDNMPEAVADLVRQMTTRQPEQRPANLRQLAAALQTGRQPVDKPAQPVAGARRRTWRRGWLAAPLVLATAVGGTYLATHRFDTPLPFSTSAAIRDGLGNLRQFDRPPRLEAAARDFTAILERDPGHAAAAAGMSLVDSFRYAGDGRDDTWRRRAAAGAQQALRLDRRLALSHVAHAWVLANQGDYEQALASAEQGLRLEPGNFFAMLGKITFLTRLKRYDEARLGAEEALRKYAGAHAFANLLGTLHFEQGHLTEAEQAFRLSIRLQPDAVLAYANLNATLLQQGRSDEALQVLQQGLQVAPNAMLYTNLGNALFQRGDYVGAADAFEQAVTPPAGTPDNYLGWANLADTLLWIPGRGAEARQAYRKARDLIAPELERRPNDATLLSRLGLYAARGGDMAASIDLLRRAAALAPSDPAVHFRAGLAYELLKDRVSALAALSRAKALGYPASAIDAEPDLVSLRRDARYPRN